MRARGGIKKGEVLSDSAPLLLSAPLLPAGKGYQGAVFLGIQGYLASLIALCLDSDYILEVYNTQYA